MDHWIDFISTRIQPIIRAWAMAFFPKQPQAIAIRIPRTKTPAVNSHSC